MSTGMASEWWRVRGADSQAEGQRIELGRLSQAIIDGVLGEEDQVCGPGETQWRLIGEHPRLEEYVPPRPIIIPKEPDSAEMDMTPMIDVTFQLLIFFMLSAAFVVQKTLDMPAAKESETAKKPASITTLKQNNVFVVVKRDGTITVNDAPATLEGLTEALRAAARSRDSQEMVLDVEDEVEHETVVRVLDHAAAAQLQKVFFVHRVSKRGAAKSS